MGWRSDWKFRKFGLILAASLMVISFMVVNVQRSSAQISSPAFVPQPNRHAYNPTTWKYDIGAHLGNPSADRSDD